MLSAFYTDICGNIGLGRLSALGEPFSGKLRRLASRRVPSPVGQRTRTFPLRTAFHLCRKLHANQNAEGQYSEDLRWQCALGRAAANSGFGNATHFFSFLAEFPPLVVSAKEQGLKIVSEVYILLSTERIVAEERRAFPGWDPESGNFDAVRRKFFSKDVLLQCTDHFVCPSEAVRDDLIREWGVSAQVTAVVPYGVNVSFGEQRLRPKRGRVLFVGTADLRKGIHYFAMAAQKLVGHRLEFRVAGDVSPSVFQQPICRYLNFVGRVPRNWIHEEFQSADLFVLPTLAEGSAEVTYQALAAGLPVITTKAAGSVVRDGIEGRIVPERDPDALAAAIRELSEDRHQRDRMASAARERAREFTQPQYGARLLTCLRGLP